MTAPDPKQIAAGLSTEEIRARVEHWYATTTPEEKAEMWRKQRESWIRAFGPCEHGDYDWETCPQCLEKYAVRAELEKRR